MEDDTKIVLGDPLPAQKANQTIVTAETEEELVAKSHEAFLKLIPLLIDHGKTKYEKDFFLVRLLTDKALDERINSRSFHTAACPTPDYDQAVFHYKRDTDELDCLWVIPDRASAWRMLQEKDRLNASTWGLLKYVLDFNDGTLHKIMSDVNGEEYGSIKLKKTKTTLALP